ncbi:hypothetical protein LTR17_025114 [Elasticomyces elasticus]|nr:hypothetical protein LTR17_025114 [Elasticomyces elasticus]
MSNVGPPYITHINYFCPAPEQHHDHHHDQQHTEPLDNPVHDNENIYADEFALRDIGGFSSHHDHFNDDRFIRHWHACMQEQRRWAVEYQAMHNISGCQQAMLAEDALMGLDHDSCPYCASMGVRLPGLGMLGMRGHRSWYEQNVAGQSGSVHAGDAELRTKQPSRT